MTNKGNVKVVLFLVGFFVLSPMATYITIDLIGAPFSLPEILLIPFLIFLYKKIVINVNYNIFIPLVLIHVLLLCISIIISNFDSYSILSTARGYLYLIIGYSIANDKTSFNLNDIYIISLGSVIGWCLLSLIRFRTLFIGIGDDSLAVYGNMITLALLIIIPIIKKNNTQILFAIILVVLLSLTSGIRRQILVSFISLAGAYALIILANTKKSTKSIILFFIVIVTLGLNYNLVKESINDVSPLLRYRIFTKTELLFSGNTSESDNTRINYAQDFISNIDENLLPKGFVSKQTMKSEEASVYMDFPLSELNYMLGFLILLPLLVYYFLCIIFKSFKYITHKNEEAGVWAIVGFVMFSLLFIEGSFLNYPFTTIVTGYSVGKLNHFKFKFRK